MTSYAAMPFDVVLPGDVVAARPRTRPAARRLEVFGGQVRLVPAPRTDVFIPAPGSLPGGHPV